MIAKNKTNEIHVTRIYQASVKEVWNAWTQSQQLEKWWGPRGYTTLTKDINVKKGGSWSYQMRGPDGADYFIKNTFLEVENNAYLIYDHGGNDEKAPICRVRVDFSDFQGKTKMQLVMTFATPEIAYETEKFVRSANGYSTWDRLAEVLSSEDIFVINRSFDVAPNKMFDFWTQPEKLSRWLPPVGFTMKFYRGDVNSGGSSFYSMSGPNGMKMYGRTHYREIRRPELLTYTQVFCDENEKITRHPMSSTWPETMLTRVDFQQEYPERTRITITWKIDGEADDASRETFKNAKENMNLGWSTSFDQLESELKKA